MSILFDCQKLSKAWASAPIFSDVTFSAFDGDRIGIIGPNGAGKSTLLKIIAGEVSTDSGCVTKRKGITLGYVPQLPAFQGHQTINEILHASDAKTSHPDAAASAMIQAHSMLMQAGFTNLDAPVASFSGGWQKRLAIVLGFAFEPDVVLLDEPTNHLDLAGIIWLEKLLLKIRTTWLMISHDRALLNSTAKKIIEVNRVFPSNTLLTDGNYAQHVDHRTLLLDGLQAQQESLQNKLRREKEWLSHGPKARGTKAKSRIDQAQVLEEKVGQLVSKSSTHSLDLSFSASGGKSKILMKMENISLSIGETKILQNFSFTVQNKQTIGILGNNGSGKSSLLNLMAGRLKAQSGTSTELAQLRVVYFIQDRSTLNPTLTLKQTICPDSDSVKYQGQLIHFASWLRRFGFSPDHFHTKIGSLSGGEQARVLIAQLMLQPADLLLLDEPTNDLDIQTLDALEQSIREFAGATIIVTHDRYLMERLCNNYLGFTGTEAGEKKCMPFASVQQWHEYNAKLVQGKGSAIASDNTSTPLAVAPPKQRGKLSYLEQREYDEIELSIAGVEEALTEGHKDLAEAAGKGDNEMLRIKSQEVQALQEKIDALYLRWQALEAKLNPQ
jgi:ATP-binding cassette subfamily F protein uup